MIKLINKKYDSISKLLAEERCDKIGICSPGDNVFYIHNRNEIYDFVNPLSSYKYAVYQNSVLCIVL